MSGRKSMMRFVVVLFGLSLVGWASAEEDYSKEIARMEALGLQHGSAWELYQALEKKANGGKPLSWRNVPDWSGVYTRTKGGTVFDPEGPPQGEYPATAEFTPEFHARTMEAVEGRANAVEYDPLSQCVPPGYPRWFSLPFLREFIVTPNQTTMVAEAFNSVRRIYTDGREHIPEADRYPTENGDSIGFWDGDRLVTHTNQLMSGMYERAQGFYTEEVEGVEIWERVDDRTIVAHLWLYDPPALREPWYTRQSFTRLDNDEDKSLRIRHWACKGNPNNNVVETEEGGSQFTDFTWMKDDDKKSQTDDKKSQPQDQR
jgi:hypothetical protein